MGTLGLPGYRPMALHLWEKQPSGCPDGAYCRTSVNVSDNSDLLSRSLGI